ncbi:hypothetical protein EYF80_001880 [Liparis tanakae]|uniref:Uncharacterized protein n=1 Tax=Liparis tanakae TaxID=230148 RepID=A0A4Z2JCI1_9TELE|nr:hypothetical protein EYF80_001880 [Liparis tanakae]
MTEIHSLGFSITVSLTGISNTLMTSSPYRLETGRSTAQHISNLRQHERETDDKVIDFSIHCAIKQYSNTEARVTDMKRRSESYEMALMETACLQRTKQRSHCPLFALIQWTVLIVLDSKAAVFGLYPPGARRSVLPRQRHKEPAATG